MPISGGFWTASSDIRHCLRMASRQFAVQNCDLGAAGAAVPSPAELRSAPACAQMPPRIIDEIGLRYFLLCTRQNRVESKRAASPKRTSCADCIRLGAFSSSPIRPVRAYCSVAYSALASFRMGISGSFIVGSDLSAPRTCSGTLSRSITTRGT
jgi:hypothetical protein